MNEKALIEKIASSLEGMQEVPSRAKIFAVRRHSLDEIQQRVKRFLDMSGEVFGLPFERRDTVVKDTRTLIRMPLGGRAVAYHASGAMKIATGLGPMDSLFKKVEDRKKLLELVEETAKKLKIRERVERNESLAFERLWQIKAAAADRKGESVKPILCRVVGAYRHSVADIPVWGAASVAIKLASKGALDSLTIQMRETTGEVIDRAKIVPPSKAAQQIVLRMSSLTGESKTPITEIAEPKWLRFGYLSFSKRKSQSVLAPVYIAAIEIEGEEESQAYVFAVPATKGTYLPLPLHGSDAPPTPLRKAG